MDRRAQTASLVKVSMVEPLEERFQLSHPGFETREKREEYVINDQNAGEPAVA